MNHLSFDGQLHLPLPYPAFPHDHQMHHRIPTCNYSTLTTVFDRYFGSFRPYQPIGEQAEAKVQPTRSEAVPSPWAVVGLGVAIIIAALLAEASHTLAPPSPDDLTRLVPVIGALVPAALACAAC